VSRDDLAARLSTAYTGGSLLRVRGAGTWLTAQRPIGGEIVDVGACAGIVEYVPGDLTITARAGTSLRELTAVTAAEGQWLALEPFGEPSGTIGATVATASDGPLAPTFGRVRDLVLGLEVITGTGEVTRAGGRVVKNVAGFDLVRLHVGAWGTLGVITEVTLRLRARPEVDQTFVVTGDPRATLEAWLAPLASMAIAPMALELINAPLAQQLGLSAGTTLLIRLGGNADRVAAQRRALDALGDVVHAPDDLFARLATCATTPMIAARVSHERTRVFETWRHVSTMCSRHQAWRPLLSASLARGVVRVMLPLPDAAPQVTDWSEFTRTLAPPGAHTAWEQLPADAWPHVPSAVADALSVRLRAALDPAHVLNRGLLGEPFTARSGDA
jgi:glycolate oxidase FAD binding subunit